MVTIQVVSQVFRAASVTVMAGSRSAPLACTVTGGAPRSLLRATPSAAAWGTASTVSTVAAAVVAAAVREEVCQFVASGINFTLSIYKSYKLRKRMIFKRLSGYWFNHLYLSGGINKFVLKSRSLKKTNYRP
jgi:hypothetical protein